MLASPQFEARAELGVRFRALPGAVALLRRRTPVRAYIGSAEILGTLVFAQPPIDAAETAATLYLREPTVLVPGAAFVVRRVSPKTLLGGGTIAAATAAQSQECDVHPEIAAVRAALLAADIAGGTAATLGAAANVREERAAEILEGLVDDGRAWRLHKPTAYVAAERANALVDRVIEQLRASEEATPWLAGMTMQRLSLTLGLNQSGAAAAPGGGGSRRSIASARRLLCDGGLRAGVNFCPRRFL